eukprot:g47403.t1
MQRRSTEGGDAYSHSAELARNGGKLKLPKRRRRHSANHEEPPYFSICINLGDVPPEKVNATITGRTVNINGERVELIEETDGMIRRNYQGFSNTFNIPPEVDIDTLNLTICEKHTLLVEAEYLEDAVALEEYVPRSPTDQIMPRHGRLKSFQKINTSEPEHQDLKLSRIQDSWENLSDDSSYGNSPFESFHTAPSSFQRTIRSSVDSRRRSSLEKSSRHNSDRRGSDRRESDRSGSERRESDRRGSKSHSDDSRRSSHNTENIQKSSSGDRRSSLSAPAHSSHRYSRSSGLLSPTPEISGEDSESPGHSSEITTTDTSKLSTFDKATSTTSMSTTDRTQRSATDAARRAPTSPRQACPPKQRSPIGWTGWAFSPLEFRK